MASTTHQSTAPAQAQCPVQPVEVHIRCSSTPDVYTLAVPDQLTVKQLKQMAIGHFISPAEAVPSTNSLTFIHLARFSSSAGFVERSSIDNIANNVTGVLEQPRYLMEDNSDKYKLLLATDVRSLSDDLSLATENIINGAALVLVPKLTTQRPPPDDAKQLTAEQATVLRRAMERGLVPPPLQDGPAPSAGEISSATAHLPCLHSTWTEAIRQKAIKETSKLPMRRIMLCVAHSAMRQLGDARQTQNAFTAIISKLEKRHKSSMKPESLKKLEDMGFSDSKAAMALKLKNTVEDAANWLLENRPDDLTPPPPPHRPLREGDDPVTILMPHFWHFMRRYFLPCPEAYYRLVAKGFDRTKVFDALMQLENDEPAAEALLLQAVGEGAHDPVYATPSRQHPIMKSIFSSAVIQSSLHKPKVLYALLALCENPSNVNLWLSDPDTNAVVNIILKKNHEERFNRECHQEVAQ